MIETGWLGSEFKAKMRMTRKATLASCWTVIGGLIFLHLGFCFYSFE